MEYNYFPSPDDTDIGIHALLCGEWVKIISAQGRIPYAREKYQVTFLTYNGVSNVYAPGKPFRWVRPEELQPHPAPQPIWTLGGPDYTAEEEAHKAWVKAYQQSEIDLLYHKATEARQLSLIGF